jgi:hypothetical protein
VDGGHETLDDAELVVDNLGEGRKAVGRAGRVGDDGVLGVVRLKVDTADEHGCVSRGRRNDDLLGSTLQVGRGLLGCGEDTGRLDDIMGANGAPGDIGGVLLGKDRDGLALDPELAILGLYSALEAAVDGVILEHVDLKAHQKRIRKPTIFGAR